MPVVAAAVRKSGAVFYWHLGDFRAIYETDEDMGPPNQPGKALSPDAAYLKTAWPSFIEHQLAPFGSLEVFLGIGNHEAIAPKNLDDYLSQFKAYLDSPRLRKQRHADGDGACPRSYYHWVMKGNIDFMSLDNANNSAFGDAQMDWFRKRVAADQKSRAIRTIVVAAHEALPGSKGMSHSMCDTADGIRSGREVYNALWTLHEAGKKVYLLASHSHFVMDDVYNTDYWKGKVLPGWIVGTGGAIRYRLPSGVPVATIARTDVYGYLTADVMSDGTIQFAFNPLDPPKTTDALINWCYTENQDMTPPVPKTCEAQ